MKARWLVIITLLLGAYTPVPAIADEEVERHCFGLLWCTEREGDHRYRDGFLWLYSSEDRGPYSRLAIRPLYSEEIDPTKDLLRRSVLWPLGTYDRVGDSISSRLVPFYWHGEAPSRRYTVVPPLYFDYANDDRSSTFFLPFYVHRTQGSYYHQRFFLGPFLISTEDTRRDLHRWDVFFPLGGHSSYADGADTWLAPVYFSGHQDSTGRIYQFVLPLYGQSDSPGSRFRFLFPLFGSEQDDSAQLSRFSLLGLPPLPTSRTLPTLALYEHVTASDWTSHRFFPLYRYVAHDTEGTDLNVLLLYQHQSSAQAVADRLFPLYNVEEDRTRPASIGFQQWSLFHYAKDPSRREHRLLGLYSYSHEVHDESSTLGMLGYGDLSLFRYYGTSSALAHRFFPLYRYRLDLTTGEFQFDMLLLYRHLTTPSQTADRLLPMWDYQAARDNQDWQISVLGLNPLVLVHHEANGEITANHVFPFYGYRGSEVEGFRLSMLGLPPTTRGWAWSVYEHRRTASLVADRVFPLYGFEINDATGERDVSLIGIPGASWFMYQATPSLTAHRLLPLYTYARDRSADETNAMALLLYWYGQRADASQHSLLPVLSYQMDRAKGDQTVAFLGLDPILPVSWFRHTSSPEAARSFLFPLYDYRQDRTDTSFSLGGAGPQKSQVAWLSVRSCNPTLVG